jgi:hypothetical protein
MMRQMMRDISFGSSAMPSMRNSPRILTGRVRPGSVLLLQRRASLGT